MEERKKLKAHASIAQAPAEPSSATIFIYRPIVQPPGVPRASLASRERGDWGAGSVSTRRSQYKSGILAGRYLYKIHLGPFRRHFDYPGSRLEL